MPDTAYLDAVLERHGHDAANLLQILIEIQQEHGYIPPQAIDRIATKLAIPRVKIESVADFYSFLHLEPRGAYRVLFSDNITDRMLGSESLMKLLCSELWAEPGKLSEDGLVSIDATSCTGMSDQSPAILVNGITITNLSAPRVQEIAELIRKQVPLAGWPAEYFHVEDNIRRTVG